MITISLNSPVLLFTDCDGSESTEMSDFLKSLCLDLRCYSESHCYFHSNRAIVILKMHLNSNLVDTVWNLRKKMSKCCRLFLGMKIVGVKYWSKIDLVYDCLLCNGLSEHLHNKCFKDVRSVILNAVGFVM